MNDRPIIRAVEPEEVAALTDIGNQPRAVWGTMQTPFTSIRKERFCRPM